MSVITPSEFSRLLLNIYQMAQSAPMEDFSDLVLEEIKKSVPFNSSMWGTAIATERGIDIHTIHLHNSPKQMLIDYEQVKDQDDMSLSLANKELATIQFNAGDVYERPETIGLRELTKKYGHENILITADTHPITKFVHWISLYRADPVARYTEDEYALIASLGPHLMQALSINRIINLDKVFPDASRNKWSVAISDFKGKLHHINPEFSNLLSQEVTRVDDEYLPSEVTKSLVDTSKFIGNHVVMVASVEGDILFIKARKKHPIDLLTEKEFFVAKLLTEGMTVDQVADTIHRSPNTIRTHVKTIFKKLNIGKVANLAPLVVLRD